jgi:lipoyl(octanoyl) transferase
MVTADRSVAANTTLQVYLLGTVEFEALLRLQRRLHYEASGQRDQAILVVCEHPPLITVGRQGSRAHVLCGPEELRCRRWPIRWVNRGGGCLLHLPGQLAFYPILPLDRLGFTVPDYLERLHGAISALLGDFGIQSEWTVGRTGVSVGARPVAAVGVAVHDWVSYFGAWLNVCPDLELFKLVRWGGNGTAPMTSLMRERHGAVRPGMVRERLVDCFREGFGFERVALFSDHRLLDGETRRCKEQVVIQGER